jgi:hypothetical protein
MQRGRDQQQKLRARIKNHELKVEALLLISVRLLVTVLVK